MDDIIAALEILKLLEKFRFHEFTIKVQGAKQIFYIDVMHEITRQYLDLKDRVIHNQYADILGKRLISSYNKNLELMRISLEKVAFSFRNLQKACDKFDEKRSELDLTMIVRRYLTGGYVMYLPLSSFVDLLTDLYVHYESSFLKCIYCVDQMQPEYWGPLEAFMDVLMSSDDYKGHIDMFSMLIPIVQ